MLLLTSCVFEKYLGSHDLWHSWQCCTSNAAEAKTTGNLLNNWHMLWFLNFFYTIIVVVAIFHTLQPGRCRKGTLLSGLMQALMMLVMALSQDGFEVKATLCSWVAYIPLEIKWVLCTKNGSKVLTKMHFPSESLLLILQTRQNSVIGITSWTEAKSDLQIYSMYVCTSSLFKIQEQKNCT